jgi:hypothetical protein
VKLQLAILATEGDERWGGVCGGMTFWGKKLQKKGRESGKWP